MSQARTFANNWTLSWFGLWGFEGNVTGRPFSWDDHIDPTWAPDDLDKLVRYLGTAPVVVAAQEAGANCFKCGEWLQGSAYHSDGVLLWPDDLAHMVEKHHFVLPDAWVAHIRDRGHKAPKWVNTPIDKLPWPNK